MDELRREIGTATDVVARARLRTELAGLLRAGDDLPSALAELRRAADEAPGLGVVRMAVLSAARALPALDRAAFLVEIGHIARAEIAAWAAAAAEAQSEAGRPVQSARAWLSVAGDNRFPAHQRRAAARHAIKIAAGVLPAEHLAALQLRAAESSGRARLAFLREALVLASAEGIDRPARLAAAAAWIEAGGAPARVEPLLEAAEKAGGPVAEEVTRLRREIDRRWRAAVERSEGGPPNGGRAHASKSARAPGARRAGRIRYDVRCGARRADPCHAGGDHRARVQKSRDESRDRQERVHQGRNRQSRRRQGRGWQGRRGAHRARQGRAGQEGRGRRRERPSGDSLGVARRRAPRPLGPRAGCRARRPRRAGAPSRRAGLALLGAVRRPPAPGRRRGGASPGRPGQAGPAPAPHSARGRAGRRAPGGARESDRRGGGVRPRCPRRDLAQGPGRGPAAAPRADRRASAEDARRVLSRGAAAADPPAGRR